jgi:hypothetical protein
MGSRPQLEAAMKRPILDDVDRRAIASGAAAAALQLAEDLTFPMGNRDDWEELRCELRDGFLTVVAEAFTPTTTITEAR